MLCTTLSYLALVLSKFIPYIIATASRGLKAKLVTKVNSCEIHTAGQPALQWQEINCDFQMTYPEPDHLKTISKMTVLSLR